TLLGNAFSNVTITLINVSLELIRHSASARLGDREKTPQQKPPAKTLPWEGSVAQIWFPIRWSQFDRS
ncbi:MAG: hypothetical protein OXH39_04265, partial [Candidatus Poribacteria bacterium]|nr:hypothetical protein [Candidatus Poribacteria bacterium]